MSLNGNGSIVAIGAMRNDGAGGSDSGHVRIYQYNSTSWVQLGSDIDGEAGGDNFGSSVSLDTDGTRIAVGAVKNDGNGADSGHVRVYEFNSTSWNQLGSDIDGEAGGDNSGHSVALNGDGTIVAIGAPYNGNTNGQNSGHVRVYEFNSTSWNQLGSDIDGAALNDESGFSVALSDNGTVIAIGAPKHDGNSYSENGHVRVYQYNSTHWNQLGSDIFGEYGFDHSGYSVSLNTDGTVVAIGAIRNRGNPTWQSSKGHVRVYQLSNGNWVQLGSDIVGEDGGDELGWSVALNGNGAVVAIGARGDDAAGTDSGQVRVYEYVSTGWAQIGDDLDGDDATDRFGSSVALNTAGTVAAAGGIYHGNGADFGHVKVFASS